MTRVKSPKYPSFHLSKAIDQVRKVYDADQTSPLPREVVAKHIGYSGLSGASDGAISTIGQYGLLARISKAEMQVTQLAVDILLPENDIQKQNAINTATLKPPLFQELWNHFDKRVPSDEALKTYLLRREFNVRAVNPILKSFAPTMSMYKGTNETESGGIENENKPELEELPLEEISNGVSAAVGDLIQWESQGVLQFKEPKLVRWVSDDKQFLAVEGDNTGIPMSDVIIEQNNLHNSPPPAPPIPPQQGTELGGFTEWFRAKVGSDKVITINYKGEDEIGPVEIEKMILILEAQKQALKD